MKRILLLIFFLVLLSQACNYPKNNLSQVPTAEIKQMPTYTSPPEQLSVEITFHVQIPQGTPLNQPVLIKVMDEVNGLAFRSQSYEMHLLNNQYYETKLTFPMGSVIKYRYSRLSPNSEIQEHLSDNRPVRYRMYYAISPGVVDDVVSAWTDIPYQGGLGRIQGQITDVDTGQPVPDLLIAVGGAQAFSASDGSFLVEGIPAGVHNLVAYALDGAYHTFQQGAKIAPDSTTPTQIFIKQSALVDVVFNLRVPENTIPAVPIRIAGNLYQFGNTFSDLSGGISTIASRMPALALQPDGKYSLTLAIPEGTDIHYLYTLGDGLWNSELDNEGSPNLHQLVIPGNSITIEDSIISWRDNKTKPITFDITVPENTPPEDFISIQFRPVFGWTESIPMWQLGDNRWVFILNNPLNFVENLNYRICRNNQCGIADDERTTGSDNPGISVSKNIQNQTIDDVVSDWANLNPQADAQQVITPQITPRPTGFWSGIELLPEYNPTWIPIFSNILDEVQRTGANWLILTPSWSYTRNSPPVLEIVAGEDPFWKDVNLELFQASDRGFQIAIKPITHFPIDINVWWSSGNRDLSWWQVWFERYRNFALHHADLAALSGAQALILGGDWLSPALPGGLLAGNEPSGVPIDADARWRLLISEVKNHYGGPLFWDLSYNQIITNPPAFLDIVDGIYLQWSEPLVGQGKTYSTQAELDKEAARLFDNGVIPLLARFNKPLVISITYPSVDGVASGCIPASDSSCLNKILFNHPNPEAPSAQINLQEQVDLYNAILSVVNQRNWISGVVSASYYPVAKLSDKSSSIHGKPAEELLAYWYANFYLESESEP